MCSTRTPPAPPAPAPVDPGRSALDFTRAMADPALQNQLIGAEREFRPQYTAENLRDINNYLNGVGGQMGVLGQLEQTTQRVGDIESAALRRQREADISDVERLGGRATQAFLDANPQLKESLRRANELQTTGAGGILGQRAEQFARSTGQLNADELRQLQQSTREGYAQRGVEMGTGAISGEALARLTGQRQRMQEDLQMASGLLGQQQQYGLALTGMNQSAASDPFMAILGRPGTAVGTAQGQQGYATGIMGGMQGPQLFDPNAGINLALQNQSNQANYQSSIYGAQAGLAGARAQARGAMIGGAFAGLGAFAGCWVARAAWGNDNPKWLEFRKWLFERSPYWFCSAYLENGESLANVIKQFAVLRFAVRVLLSGILQMEQKRNVPFAGLLQAVFCGFVYCLLVLQKLPSGNFLGNSRHRYQSDLRICHSDVHPYPQEMPQMSSSVRKHECPVLHNLRIRAYRGICNAASLISRLSKSVLNITRGDNCVASCALGEQNAQAVRMSTQKP